MAGKGPKLRILVVEDHALVREGLLIALRSLSPGAVTIGASDALEAVKVLEEQEIDLMLLDLMLPGTPGQALLPVIRRRFPTVPVVVLSALDDAGVVAGVMKSGAAGFVSKASSSSELLAALQKVLRGEVVVPGGLTEAVTRSQTAKADGLGPFAQRYGLTPAQMRVLEQLSNGGSNRQIADVLGLTEGTVKIHVSSILRALKVSNRSEVALLVNRKKAR